MRSSLKKTAAPSMQASAPASQLEPRAAVGGEDQLAPLFWSDTKPRPLWRRALLILGAVVFLILGVIGWLVPVVSGVPFYIVGFAFLGAASPRAARILNRAEARLPHNWRRGLRRMIDKVRRKPAARSANGAE